MSQYIDRREGDSTTKQCDRRDLSMKSQEKRSYEVSSLQRENAGKAEVAEPKFSQFSVTSGSLKVSAEAICNFL